MFSLNEFENSEEWRQKLKRFLYTNRRAAIGMTEEAKKTTEMSEARRYSIDVDEEFQEWIQEQRKNKTGGQKPDCGEDTFVTLEKMCDKSGSDVDSTLYKYLHTADQEQVLAESKLRYRSDHRPAERSLPGAVDASSFELAGKVNDNTLLSAVEAPSGFWENSIVPESTFRDDSIAQVSPVKMVGLMRPSTIIEETASQTVISKLAAGDEDLGSSLSSVYETAPEGPNSSCGSEAGAESLSESDQDEGLEDTVIEIDSDDGVSGENDGKDTGSMADDCDKENQSSFHPSQTAEILDESLHLNDTWEEVDYLLRKRLECMANSGNVAPEASPMTKQPDPKTPSASKKLSGIPVPLSLKTKKVTPLLSPNPVVRRAGGQIGLNSPGFKAPLPTSANGKKYHIEMKPCRKFEFNIPKASGSRNQFSHIVSPVGAYMKNTGATPLMTNPKATLSKKMDFNVSNKVVVERKEKEDVDHNGHSIDLMPLPGNYSSRKILPKKAYISSNLKHITDERTPITIPGGQKIQKYLESAMMPAVLRHDGKMKMVDSAGAGEVPKMGVDKRKNTPSIANLSLMSGDVSMYTIRDAQKF